MAARQLMANLRGWQGGQFSLFNALDYHEPQHLHVGTGHGLNLELHEEATANWRAASMLMKHEYNETLLDEIERTIAHYPRSIHAYANKAMYHLQHTPNPDLERAEEAFQQLNDCLTDNGEINNAKVQYALCSYQWGSYRFHDANQELTDNAVGILEEVVVRQGATNPSHHVIAMKIRHSEARNKPKYMNAPPEIIQRLLINLVTQMRSVVSSLLGLENESFQIRAEIQIWDLLADTQMVRYLREALAKEELQVHLRELNAELGHHHQQPGSFNMEFYLDRLISAMENPSADLPSVAQVSSRIAHHFVVASHNVEHLEDLETRLTLLTRAEEFIIIDQANRETAADVHLELWALKYYETNREQAVAAFDAFNGRMRYRDVVRYLTSYFYKQLPSHGPESVGRHHLEIVREYTSGQPQHKRIRFLLDESPDVLQQEIRAHLEGLAAENFPRRHNEVAALEHYGAFLEAVGRPHQALERYEQALDANRQGSDNYRPNIAIKRSAMLRQAGYGNRQQRVQRNRHDRW